MSQMCLNVEFLPGTSIFDAVQEASKKAEFLNLAYVVFSFNDVKISVQPYLSNKDIKSAVIKYQGASHQGNRYVIASRGMGEE